jgi:hypothetical protein
VGVVVQLGAQLGGALGGGGGHGRIVSSGPGAAIRDKRSRRLAHALTLAASTALATASGNREFTSCAGGGAQARPDGDFKF